MLKIYGIPISVHTRKALVVANHKGLKYEVIPLVPVLPATLPPNWGNLSPTGLIPVLEDGDFTLGDSSAICAYLESIHPSQAVYPTARRERARALALEAFAGDTLFRGLIRPLFGEVFIEPKIKKTRATNPTVVAHLVSDVAPSIFAFLDRAASAGYLAGNQLTVADIAVASNLMNFVYAGFDLDHRQYPHLSALFDRVVAEPAMREALRRELPLVESMGLRADSLRRMAA